MPRYYYDCPVKALWMHREFGIRIGIYEPKIGSISRDKYSFLCGGDNFIDFGTIAISYRLYTDACLDKYYIHPNSLSLLEPKEGDLLKDCDGWTHMVVNRDSYTEIGKLYRKRNHFLEIDCICDMEDKDEFEWYMENNEIVDRDGKRFFWPKEEA